MVINYHNTLPTTERCHWVNLNNPNYVKYHDDEWGHPCHDERRLFEMLVLESFQAGLSWECILNKRASFRVAFDDIVSVPNGRAKRLIESTHSAIIKSVIGGH